MTGRVLLNVAAIMAVEYFIPSTYMFMPNIGLPSQ